ncbi:dedicator of cytokinesis protein 9-like [Saccoglossus kowalevskii]|uniref:Dedicator of cytokinesis protein 9-like n=1 Tax=Saccoglossus kowalevskii TaxID=10224 RepID=A0ABM0MV98_SACKO|nr:PREDICTED: dedicator of cytokinesis protein 9-like [Saccoglossus kowalevskii]
MTSERQFAKLKRVSGVGMTWPTAKQVRESVQLAVKESRVLAKPKLVEPLDYENVIVQKKTLMHSDLQRDMLFFPHDDVAVVKVPRQLRTVRSTVPANADQEATNLFVKECIKSYNSDWYVVKKKYDAYSGHYMQLPNVEKIDSLPEQVYEIDQSDDKAEEEDTLLSPRGGIEKKGVLFKAPFGSKSKIPMMEVRHYYR